MKRYMALDVGSVRIGVAVSDPLAITAQGIAVISMTKWREKLQVLVNKYSPDYFVIGLPIRTSGEMGPEVERVKLFSHEVRSVYPDIDIYFYDERYSSKIAHQVLDESNVSAKNRRGNVDSIAAAVFLQGFLDSIRRTGNNDPS